jgi:hypothetical protein
MTSGNILVQIARFFIVRDQRKDHWEKELRKKHPNATQAEIEEGARALAHEEYNPAAWTRDAVDTVKNPDNWGALLFTFLAMWIGIPLLLFGVGCALFFPFCLMLPGK